MKRALATFAVVAVLLASGCVSDSGGAISGSSSGVMPLGAQYDSPAGSFFVISVQHEYRLIRAMSSGPISHGYEDLLSVPADSVKFNRWMRVEKAPGLELAIVSPDEVAFRFGEAGGDSK